MARSIWSGSITFGLVNVPVKLYSATDPQDVRFHQFQEGTGKRVRNKRVAEGTDDEVEYEDIVKGYEVEDGQYVVVTREELESVEPGRSRTIELEDFIDLDEIDPIYYEKTYYLAPAEDVGAERPYALLLRAMEESSKVGIGRFVMRGKQYLTAIRPMGNILALETMFFADEVRSARDLDTPSIENVDLSKRELSVAQQLIDSLASEWDPTRYEDTYRERILQLIREKAEGREVVVSEEAETPEMPDLMEALRASVEAARQGRRPAAAASKEGSADGDGHRAESGDGDLDDLTVDELRDRAARAGVSGRSRMKKDELVEALRKAS